MELFTLQDPVDAVRYVRNENEQEVAELFKRGGGRPSYSNGTGAFHIYGDNLDLIVQEGQWVVGLGGSVVVMNDAEFTKVFSPI